ncbi:MAG: STN domain-containing protein [Gammaproteobacteria bacterium]
MATLRCAPRKATFAAFLTTANASDTTTVSAARRAVLGQALLALAGALALRPTSASKLDKLAFKIAAGTAPAALAEFIRQTGFQVLFDFDAVRNINTHEVTGQLDAEEALSRMFAGSDLTFEFINDRTISVRARPPAALPATQAIQKT